jgi:pimeloyl-ACP methyl ester carboxylesterase
VSGGGGLAGDNAMKIGRFAQVLLFIAVMFLELPAYAQIPTDGLVGYWSFDDGTANLTAGSANNGQPTSAVTFGPGKSGMAAVFQGVDNPGHIYIPNSAALQFTSGATYSVWVRVDALKAMDGRGNTVTSYGGGTVFAKSHDRIGAAFGFSVNSANEAGAGVGSFASWAAGQSDPLWTPQKQVGDWAHLTCIFSASSGIKIYVDGQLYRTSTNPVLFADMNGQDLFIGKFSDSWYPFYGAIDEVRIYNRVLNEAEIAELAGGLTQSPGSFVFSPISSPVEPNTCFPVRIEARTAGGTLDTTVNGYATLSANFGGVSSKSLYFNNGVAVHGCITVPSPGKNKQLTAQGLGLSGTSNSFECVGTCFGSIALFLDPDTTAILFDQTTNAEVGRQVSTEDPQSNIYMVKFANVPCGAYRLRVEKGPLYKDNIELNVTGGNVKVEKISLPQPGIKGTPVILIPGIMGSSRPVGKWDIVPLLGDSYPDKSLRFHGPLVMGWNDLELQLIKAGYTVFRCPWDWRSGIGSKNGTEAIRMKENVKNFLIPVIDEALRHPDSTTGKVSIVAHSMGGLVARAYIQSADLYRNDVENLALIGVPHLGSVKPYFLWEAGDAITGDKIFDDTFYTDVIKRMWEDTYGQDNWKNCNAKAIKEFIHEKSPSLRQLMSTDYCLMKEDGTTLPVESDGNVNVWLNELNNGTNGFKKPTDVFSKDFGAKVKTRVFLSNSGYDSTLEYIQINNKIFTYPDKTTSYVDGIPSDVGPITCAEEKAGKKATNNNELFFSGDGTVPLDSAAYPLKAGWADRAEFISGKSHTFMIWSFLQDIPDFLDGNPGVITEPKSVVISKETTKDAVNMTPQLGFSVIGNAGLLITDTLGRKSGISPDTHALVNEIPGADIVADETGASVSFSDAPAGQYHLTYFGYSEQSFSLSVSAFNASGEAEEESFKGYKPASPQTIVIQYNPLLENQIVVQPVVAEPQEMEAVSYSCGSAKCTQLRWKPTVAIGVKEYVIYRRLLLESMYSELARVPVTATNYKTGEAWNSDESLPLNGYKVSAIKADETESFFAKDKEGECVFPWPMFLPAITHGTQHP